MSSNGSASPSRRETDHSGNRSNDGRGGRRRRGPAAAATATTAASGTSPAASSSTASSAPKTDESTPAKSSHPSSTSSFSPRFNTAQASSFGSREHERAAESNQHHARRLTSEISAIVGKLVDVGINAHVRLDLLGHLSGVLSNAKKSGDVNMEGAYSTTFTGMLQLIRDQRNPLNLRQASCALLGKLEIRYVAGHLQQIAGSICSIIKRRKQKNEFQADDESETVDLLSRAIYEILSNHEGTVFRDEHSSIAEYIECVLLHQEGPAVQWTFRTLTLITNKSQQLFQQIFHRVSRALIACMAAAHHGEEKRSLCEDLITQWRHSWKRNINLVETAIKDTLAWIQNFNMMPFEHRNQFLNDSISNAGCMAVIFFRTDYYHEKNARYIGNSTIDALLELVKLHPIEQILGPVNDFCYLFVEHLKPRNNVQIAILRMLFTAIKNNNQLQTLTLEKCLQTILKLISNLVEEIPPELMSLPISADSFLFQLRQSENPEVAKLALEINRTILNQSVSLEVYALCQSLCALFVFWDTYIPVQRRLECAHRAEFNQLHTAVADWLPSLFTHFDHWHAAVRKRVVQFSTSLKIAGPNVAYFADASIQHQFELITTLMQVSTFADSLSYCYYSLRLFEAAKSPLFPLFIAYFLAAIDISVEKPSHRMQFDILRILNIIAERQDVHSCVFLIVVRCLIKIVTSPEKALDTKLLVLRWLCDCSAHVDRWFQRCKSDSAMCSQMSQLIADLHEKLIRHSGLEPEEEVRLGIIMACQSTVKFLDLRLVSGEYKKMLISRLNDSSPEVAESILQMITDLHPIDWMLLREVAKEPSDLSFEQHVMHSSPTGTFRPHHFTEVFGVLLGVPTDTPITETSVFSSEIRTWEYTVCIRLFHACQTLQNMERLHAPNNRTNTSYSSTSFDTIKFWCLWEAARICVLARMKTPIGGPRELFEVLQLALKRAPVSNTLDRNCASAQQIAAVLDFINLFQKQVVNAMEGSAILPASPRKSVEYFHGNEAMFRGLFEDLEMKAIQLIGVSGCLVHSLRHANELLRKRFNELKTGSVENVVRWHEEVEALLLAFAEGLLACREPDVVAGLALWTEKAFRQVAVSSVTTRAEEGLKIKIEIRPSRDISGLADRKFTWMEAVTRHCLENYEAAIDGYKTQIERLRGWERASSSIPVRLESFLHKQLLDCYVAVCDWDSLNEWTQAQLQSPALSENEDLRSLYIQAREFGSFISLRDQMLESADLASLLDRQLNIGKATSSDAAFNQKQLQNAFSFDLALLKKLYVEDNASQSIVSQPRDLLSIHANSSEPIYLIDSAVIRLQCDKMLSSSSSSSLLSSSTQESNPSAASSTSAASGRVFCVQDFSKAPPRLEHLSLLSRLRLLPAKLDSDVLLAKHARKNECVALASRILSKEIAAQDENKASLLLMERAKLCVLEDKPLEAVRIAMDLILKGVSKAYLQLGRWSQFLRTSNAAESLKPSLVGLFHEPLQLTTIRGYTRWIDCVIDSAFGTYCHVKPAHAKGWLEFGNWLYRQASRLMDQFQSGKAEGLFSDAELKKILVLIKGPLSDAVDDKAVKDVVFLNTLENIMKDAASHLFDPLESVKISFDNDQQVISELARIFKKRLVDLSPSSLVQLATILYAGYCRIAISYRESVESFFSFLLTATGKTSRQHSVAVTLRLFRLLVKHGARLRESYSKGLASVNTALWEDIIPQLFSRLDHESVFVRDSLAQILSSISVRAPQKIVYQLIVNINDTGTDSFASPLRLRAAAGSAGGDADTVRRSDDAPYRVILKAMMEKSNEQTALLVQQVKELVRELQHVTVLWEEMWLNQISHLQPEMARAVERITVEIGRLKERSLLTDEEKSHILIENYSTVMKPVASSMEKLYADTCGAVNRTPTPHEKWFSDQYGNRIKRTVQELKSPANVQEPQSAWNMMKDLFGDLSNQMLKVRSLQLDEISPYLSKLRSTSIPVPGLERSDDGGNENFVESRILIESFDANIMVLPTKTKPKRMSLVGSDGRRYRFLLKGLDDLHLDERIMQFIAITNRQLRSDSAALRRHLHARSYAVIPLGERSGMIQWIENAHPLFSFVRSWEKHQHLLSEISAAEASAVAPLNATSGRGPIMTMFSSSSSKTNSSTPIELSRSKSDQSRNLVHGGGGGQQQQHAPPSPHRLTNQQNHQLQHQPKHHQQIAKGHSKHSRKSGGTSNNSATSRGGRDAHAHAHAMESSAAGAKENTVRPILKPQERFLNRVKLLLKERGVSIMSPRDQWPLEVLRQAFAEMLAGTPADLLSREIWMSSPGASEWWTRSLHFARSCAVNSMIGYIIGLGDRHLDNIMLDLQTGELVHIDYSVCFEKGHKLRVPERVPFRLTTLLENALGVTGVEGPFRIASEDTLRVIRDNRDSLLSLLEAFIYDPLVDWDLEKREALERNQMGLDIALGLLSSRLVEAKVSIADRKGVLETISTSLVQALNSAMTLISEREECVQELKLDGAGIDRISRNGVALLAGKLREVLREFQRAINEHEKAYSVLKNGSSLPQLAADMQEKLREWSATRNLLVHLTPAWTEATTRHGAAEIEHIAETARQQTLNTIIMILDDLQRYQSLIINISKSMRAEDVEVQLQAYLQDGFFHSSRRRMETLLAIVEAPSQRDNKILLDAVQRTQQQQHASGARHGAHMSISAFCRVEDHFRNQLNQHRIEMEHLTLVHSRLPNMIQIKETSAALQQQLAVQIPKDLSAETLTTFLRLVFANELHATRCQVRRLLQKWRSLTLLPFSPADSSMINSAETSLALVAERPSSASGQPTLVGAGSPLHTPAAMLSPSALSVNQTRSKSGTHADSIFAENVSSVFGNGLSEQLVQLFGSLAGFSPQVELICDFHPSRLPKPLLAMEYVRVFGDFASCSHAILDFVSGLFAELVPSILGSATSLKDLESLLDTPHSYPGDKSLRIDWSDLWALAEASDDSLESLTAFNDRISPLRAAFESKAGDPLEVHFGLLRESVLRLQASCSVILQEKLQVAETRLSFCQHVLIVAKMVTLEQMKEKLCIVFREFAPDEIGLKQGAHRLLQRPVLAKMQEFFFVMAEKLFSVIVCPRFEQVASFLLTIVKFDSNAIFDRSSNAPISGLEWLRQASYIPPFHKRYLEGLLSSVKTQGVYQRHLPVIATSEKRIAASKNLLHETFVALSRFQFLNEAIVQQSASDAGMRANSPYAIMTSKLRMNESLLADLSDMWETALVNMATRSQRLFPHIISSQTAASLLSDMRTDSQPILDQINFLRFVCSSFAHFESHRVAGPATAMHEERIHAILRQMEAVLTSQREERMLDAAGLKENLKKLANEINESGANIAGQVAEIKIWTDSLFQFLEEFRDPLQAVAQAARNLESMRPMASRTDDILNEIFGCGSDARGLIDNLEDLAEVMETLESQMDVPSGEEESIKSKVDDSLKQWKQMAQRIKQLITDIAMLPQLKDSDDKAEQDDSANQREKGEKPDRRKDKNTYAVQILRRIRSKIEGNVSDSRRRVSVSDQVENVIQEATNVDNLCRMYEGWMPWI